MTEPAAWDRVAGAVDLDEAIDDALLLRAREEEANDRAELPLRSRWG